MKLKYSKKKIKKSHKSSLNFAAITAGEGKGDGKEERGEDQLKYMLIRLFFLASLAIKLNCFLAFSAHTRSFYIK